MMRKMLLIGISIALCAWGARGETVRFTAAPAAARDGANVRITFTVSAPTDVEVAVLDEMGKVVRHLAAGVLGAANPPPQPLAAGLAQKLTWDGADDFGKPAGSGPFTVRVRAGTAAKLDRFIGGDPYRFGEIDSIVADEDGNLYMMGYTGTLGQDYMILRCFDPDGRYLREIMPFPADLPPEAMKDAARWDADHRAFFPKLYSGLNPRFYQDGCLKLVSASKSGGIVLTDGTRIYTLELSGAVRGSSFATRVLWPKKLIPWGSIPNSGHGPVFLAVGPDGKRAYLAGPFTCRDGYGHELQPELPPGRVFALDLTAGGFMEPFVTVPVAHTNGNGGNWTKGMGYGWGPRGAVHGVAVDAAGRVYLCDRERERISVLDRDGKDVGSIPIPCADQVAVHPKTGAVYVMQKDRVTYGKWHAKLVKFAKIGDAEPAATFQFGPDCSAPKMALSAGKDRTTVWVAGTADGLTALRDEGDRFEPVQTQFAPAAGGQLDWNRLAVDYGRDEVYVSDGATKVWRYDGPTGEGACLTKGGKPFLASDLAVGYDGLLYVRVSNAQIGEGSPFSGPFWRMTRDLDPAPYEKLGSNELSHYIYSRYGIGYAERGIGVGPDGRAYLSFMYGWVQYCVAGFGPDGRPLKGKYLEGKVGGKGYPADLTSAIIGPIPIANGGLRVDLAGNLYLGMRIWPKGLAVPKGFEKDYAFSQAVGSVVKFSPYGGRVKLAGDAKDSDFDVPDGIESTFGEKIEGALAVYPGLAPFSHSPFGTTCCVCRVPRFDLDRYGRIAMPDAVQHCVRIVDNAGNLVLELGRYGNFDSQYAASAAGKPKVAVPAIPLAWPTGAGFSEDHLYVNDTCSRRVARVAFTHAAEAACEVK